MNGFYDISVVASRYSSSIPEEDRLTSGLWRPCLREPMALPTSLFPGGTMSHPRSYPLSTHPVPNPHPMKEGKPPSLHFPREHYGFIQRKIFRRIK